MRQDKVRAVLASGPPDIRSKSHKSIVLRFLAFGLVQGLDKLECADRVYLE